MLGWCQGGMFVMFVPIGEMMKNPRCPLFQRDPLGSLDLFDLGVH